MAGSVAGPIAGGLASGAAAAIFGGGGGSVGSGLSQAPVQPFGFGGLSGGLQNGRFVIQPGEARVTAVERSAANQARLADELAVARQRFSGPLGDLTRTRLQDVENRRSRAIGNLRENLARRRLAGSSFANDALARAEAEFAGVADQIRAGSMLEEIDINVRLLREETAAREQSIRAGIQELNLQADLGAALMSGVTTQLGANARLEAALEAEAAQNTGRFFAPAIEAIGSGVSSFVEDLV